jgi:hypothetical protein
MGFLRTPMSVFPPVAIAPANGYLKRRPDANQEITVNWLKNDVYLHRCLRKKIG